MACVRAAQVPAHKAFLSAQLRLSTLTVTATLDRITRLVKSLIIYIFCVVLGMILGTGDVLLFFFFYSIYFLYKTDPSHLVSPEPAD